MMSVVKSITQLLWTPAWARKSLYRVESHDSIFSKPTPQMAWCLIREHVDSIESPVACCGGIYCEVTWFIWVDIRMEHSRESHTRSCPTFEWNTWIRTSSLSAAFATGETEL
jgi:hypothetical protein